MGVARLLFHTTLIITGGVVPGEGNNSIPPSGEKGAGFFHSSQREDCWFVADPHLYLQDEALRLGVKKWTRSSKTC